MSHFSITLDSDSIATILWDTPGRSMNIIDWEAMAELEALVRRIRDDAAITAVVFASAKEQFSGGADLAMLARLDGDKTMAEIKDKAGWLARIVRGLETCGKPIAAAIHGVCVGGAYEIALGCHYRVASDDAATKLGLPESKVGLLPGGGGTQRLPRLIGAQEALKLMLRGTHVEAREALKLGMVHALSPRGELINHAKAWIKAGGKAMQPWDEKGFKIPGGAPYSPQGMAMWAAANALYRKETQDNYDAQRAIMSSVFDGLSARTIDAGLKIELAHFVKLLQGPQSRTMIRSLFHSMQALGKGARRPQAPASMVKTLGMVGAGFMGAGIAHVSARAGIHVILIDRDQASAEKGKAHSATLLDKEISRGRMTAAEKDAVLARISPTTDFAALAPCDLVIEAVFESRAVKAETWPRIDAVLRPDAIRASNTSTLPITGLAGFVKDETSFIGIHFFSPVDKMQLVEIIRGKATSDEAVARALDYVRQIKKTPIIVNDARGFFTSRVVMTHLTEGNCMLEEGVPPAMIENAGKMAGMPVGPLALADEIALDLSWKIMQATRADLGPAYVATAMDRIVEEMVVRRERFGRKNGKGYYDYGPEGKMLWPGIAEICPPRPAANFDMAELKERLLLIQALETARCYDEAVLTDPREADVGAILGFGFAPFTGGPLSYIDSMGAEVFAAKCRAYAKRFGPRYAPPQARTYYAAA